MGAAGDAARSRPNQGGQARSGPAPIQSRGAGGPRARTSPRHDHREGRAPGEGKGVRHRPASSDRFRGASRRLLGRTHRKRIAGRRVARVGSTPRAKGTDLLLATASPRPFAGDVPRRPHLSHADPAPRGLGLVHRRGDGVRLRRDRQPDRGSRHRLRGR